MFMMMRTICKIKQKSLGAKVVIALCKTIQEKSATVYYDNFFTSLELIHYLRNEYGIFSLGTIRSNRLRGCQEMLLFDKPLAKNSRGASHQTELKENDASVKTKTPVASRPPDSARYDNIGHLPTFVSHGRQYLQYCKKGYTSVYCNKCNFRLC
ncbi:hypothetical protein SFRURICE_012192, partial [Spodoptera frugiperda]